MNESDKQLLKQKIWEKFRRCYDDPNTEFLEPDFYEKPDRPDILVRIKNKGNLQTIGVELTRYNQDAVLNPETNKIDSKLSREKPDFAWFRDVGALKDPLEQKELKYKNYVKAKADAYWLLIYSEDRSAHDFLERKAHCEESVRDDSHLLNSIRESSFQKIFLFNIGQNWFFDLKTLAPLLGRLSLPNQCSRFNGSIGEGEGSRNRHMASVIVTRLSLL